MLHPGEKGTYHAIKEYANREKIQFLPVNMEEEKLLTLIDEKRCSDKLFRGLTKLFYDDSAPLEETVDCVKVFNENVATKKHVLDVLKIKAE